MARTTTEGGTTSGYSLIGSVSIAMRPAMKITIDSTAAKIGRSMKKRDRRMVLTLRDGRVGRVLHGHHLGRNLDARAHPHEAVHDDLLAGLEPRAHDPETVVREPTELDRAVRETVTLGQHQHELAILIGPDSRVAHQQRRLALAADQLHPGEQTGREAAIAVGKDGAGPDGTGGGVDAVVDEVEPTFVGKPGLVG